MKLSQSDMNQLEKLFENRKDISLYIVDKSDAYPAAHFRLSILVSLTVSMSMYFVPWTFSDPIWYLYAQLPALLFGYLLANRKTFKRFFTTSAELAEESFQKALEVYYENKMKEDLLFISLLERKVYLINFEQTDDKAKENKKAIQQLSKEIKRSGLLKAIDHYLETRPIELSQELSKETPREESLEPQTNPTQEV